ncbi:hypothetical protein [Arsenicicoccus dermatophilus]|uniref:hypothetical protein n=1 Tax=Arsenicicoccus dermatophilus TaxID=1076331 RepID=UPI001F4CB448|nr:hypothetical protein [Arsenicicoccus dermatophilus]MCH8613946.1 hypothetical protein [Arsenicicoccus dermatophilus]
MSESPTKENPVTDFLSQPAHLILLPTEGVASHVAEQLRAEGFDSVAVVRDAQSWGVRITDDRLPVDEGGAAAGLRTRFEALAAEHEGRYVADEACGTRP